jgi:hypothetical protein
MQNNVGFIVRFTHDERRPTALHINHTKILNANLSPQNTLAF